MLCLLAPHSRLRFIHPVLAANPLVRSRAVGGLRSCSVSFYPEPAPGPPAGKRRTPPAPRGRLPCQAELAPAGSLWALEALPEPPSAGTPHAQSCPGPVKSTQGIPSTHHLPIPDQGTSTLVVCKYFYWAHPAPELAQTSGHPR